MRPVPRRTAPVITRRHPRRIPARPDRPRFISHDVRGGQRDTGTFSVLLKWSATTVTTVTNTSWTGNDAERHQFPFYWSCVVEIRP